MCEIYDIRQTVAKDILINMKYTPTLAYGPRAKQGWMYAYMAFLRSKDETFLLKIAPVLLLLGTPELVAATLIPVVGEIVDFGGISIALFVAFKTVVAVRKYRK